MSSIRGASIPEKPRCVKCGRQATRKVGMIDYCVTHIADVVMIPCRGCKRKFSTADRRSNRYCNRCRNLMTRGSNPEECKYGKADEEG